VAIVNPLNEKNTENRRSHPYESARRFTVSPIHSASRDENILQFLDTFRRVIGRLSNEPQVPSERTVSTNAETSRTSIAASLPTYEEIPSKLALYSFRFRRAGRVAVIECLSLPN
jgi:hypothetical protein